MKNYEIYNKIREIRNKHFEPKLEIILDDEEFYQLVDNNQSHLSIEEYRTPTPVTINEILLMIKKKGYFFEWNSRINQIDVWQGEGKMGDWVGAIEDFDLTKSIKEQDKEVLEKILELIK